MDIELFKILLEHSNTTTVNQLLANQRVNWLSQTLRDHFLEQTNQYLTLTKQEILSKKFADNLNQLESMNRSTHKEAIYDSLKNCKNLYKYGMVSQHKRSSVKRLSLFEDIDLNDSQKVKKKLELWHQLESKKIARLSKNVKTWRRKMKRSRILTHLKENGF